MLLKNGIDYKEFILSVRNCSGEVFYKTPGGDCLNLKSMLSEYVFIAASMSKEVPLDGQVECVSADDYSVLHGYLEGM